MGKNVQISESLFHSTYGLLSVLGKLNFVTVDSNGEIYPKEHLVKMISELRASYELKLLALLKRQEYSFYLSLSEQGSLSELDSRLKQEALYNYVTLKSKIADKEQ